MLTFLFSLPFTSNVNHFVLLIFIFPPIFPLALSPFSSSSPPPPLCFHLPGWVCARSWCKHPWRSGRWQRVRHPPLQTHGHRRWSGDFWGCSPRTAEAGCTGKRAGKAVYHHGFYHYYCLRMGKISSTTLYRWICLSKGGISCVRVLAWGAIECSTR